MCSCFCTHWGQSVCVAAGDHSTLSGMLRRRLAQACGLLLLPKLCCAVECGQLHIQAGLTCDRAKARNGGTSV